MIVRSAAKGAPCDHRIFGRQHESDHNRDGFPACVPVSAGRRSCRDAAPRVQCSTRCRVRDRKTRPWIRLWLFRSHLAVLADLILLTCDDAVRPRHSGGAGADVIAFLKRLFDAPAEQTEPQVDDDGTQGRSTVIWGTLPARRKVGGHGALRCSPGPSPRHQYVYGVH